MPTFTVIRDGSVLEDSVFDVDPVVDTANPFGDYAVVKMDDRGGEKFDAYSRGTRVEITVDPDDNTLTIQSGETVTTASGETDDYSTVNNGGTYSNQGTVTAGSSSSVQFTGYCVEPRETEQAGADVLEVEAYSFDQFLRRNTVTNDQTGNLISEALQDIIETDTPVSYNAAKIEVGDDRELTRSYRGTPVESVFRDLAFKSNNEEFGVDGDLDAFFRPQETEHIDRGIDDTQWFNYDIPELGKEAVNEVEVWFDDGNESVIVDDGTDKLDLQDSLDLPEPGTQRAELNRPLITEITDAEDIGRKYLAFRNATLSGTVTTFGLFDADPGDTIDVTIEPRGINEEFVIAATEYRWGRDETILTIVENRGDVDDILSEINDSVQRQEMAGANRDAPKNRITTTNAAALISVDVAATVILEAGGTGTVSADGVRFVNPGRSAVRDAWTGDAPPDIATLVVGDDNSGLSRSNTSLVNQTNSAGVSQTFPDATSVEFTATITQASVQEIGLEDAGGTLIARATFDSAVDLDGSVDVTLSVANDDSVSRGVLTATGQTAVRDVLANNTPATPTDYAYGSGDRPVAESDTALESEIVTASLEEVLIDSTTTQSDWVDKATQTDTEPVRVNNGEVSTHQTCFTREAENTDDEQLGQEPTLQSSDFSNGSAIQLQVEGEYAEFTFTTGHDIPSGDFGLGIRWTTFNNDAARTPNIDFILDGTSLGRFADASGTVGWITDLTASDISGPGGLEAGEHTLRIETVTSPTSDVNGDGFIADHGTFVDLAEHDLVSGSETVYDGGTTFDRGTDYEMDYENGRIRTLSGGSMTDGQGYDIDYTVNYDISFYLDVFAPYDSRYNYTFDNGPPDANEALTGPELYPDVVAVPFDRVSTQRQLDEARAEQVWKDGEVGGSQYIELSNDGSTFIRTDNSQTASATFASSNAEVFVNVGISRYSSGGTSTPTDGDVPQAVQSEDLFANVQAVTPDDIGATVARAIVPPNTAAAVGETFREAGMKSNGDLLTRHLLAEFTLLADQRLTSSESTRFAGGN